MKGIILAGGAGTRLWPATKVVTKQLLPIYDKPMIYYPLSVLMLAGIRDILIISTPKDTPRFEELFGNGSILGLNISYRVQEKPNGIAEALIIGRDFVDNQPFALILGDNIFYGHGLTALFSEVRLSIQKNKAVIFAYYVNDPSRYGIVEVDENNIPVSIEEKPKNPKSNWAVVGLYFYPPDACSIASNLKPSARGELEITDVNKAFLDTKRLDVKFLGRGYAWLDTGTSESLIEAGKFIEIIEKRQGLKIGCIEEIAYRNGWITKEILLSIASEYKNHYGDYLRNISKDF